MSARTCRVISPDEGSLRHDLPRLRIRVTRSKDGATALLYSGAPDDFDGECTIYEWNDFNGSITNPYLQMLHASLGGYLEMRPVLFEDGDDGGALLLEPSVSSDHDVVNLTKRQFAALLENGINFHA